MRQHHDATLSDRSAARRAAAKHSRRDWLGTVTAGAVAAGAMAAGAAAGSLFTGASLAAESAPYAPKGRIKQSICRWCYGRMSLEELAKTAAEIGYKSIELIGPGDWPVVKKYGLTCAMTTGTGPIGSCINDKKNHPRCIGELKKNIPVAAEAGLPNVIVMSGNRAGIPDDVAIENCVAAIKEVVGLAEEKKVTMCMELLNSKVDHKDYQCDHTAWGVEVAKRVSSPRFKLLYDIYHMQIMEGDLIRTIRSNIQYIGHFHTGGNPGRNEIDETQEICYPPVMKAIAESGFVGYVGQEFIPKRDPVESMKQAFRICDV